MPEVLETGKRDLIESHNFGEKITNNESIGARLKAEVYNWIFINRSHLNLNEGSVPVLPHIAWA